MMAADDLVTSDDPPSPGGGYEEPVLGLWTLDFGLWTLDFGLWTLDFGLWTLDLVRSPHAPELEVNPGNHGVDIRRLFLG
jgi:hypothetical protein